MSSYKKILYKIAEKSDGQMRITEAPRFTAESLKSLEKEISAQASNNETMRQRKLY